jgi:tetratricopeptide (TPR) repeat protein
MPDMIEQYRLFNRANTLHEQDSFLKAGEMYNTLLAKYPKGSFSEEAMFNLAVTEFRLEKYSDAAGHFSALQRLLKKEGRKSRNTWYNEGNALAMQAFRSADRLTSIELLQNALTRYRAVLVADPGNIDARMNYEVVARAIEKRSPPPPPPAPSPSAGTPEPEEEQQNSSLISSNLANLMLENAQREEKQLLSKYYRPGTARIMIKEDKDW